MRDRLRRALGFDAGDDAGLAVIAVAMLGMALVVFSSMVALRAQRQSDGIKNDAQWSQTLDVAEAGLDVGLMQVEGDPAFTTGEMLPYSFDRPEDAREWVIAAADARSQGDVGDTSLGEYVVVRPSNTGAVFAVGFVPSRSAETRRVRVLRAEVGEAPTLRAWQARYAILSGGPLTLNGNPTIVSGVTVGIHTNGGLNIKGSVFVDGCLSASAGSSVQGSFHQDPECVAAGSQAPVLIPTIDPREFWEYSHYDLCAGGVVRSGPAHPTHGHTANAPCNGAALSTTTPFRGWEYLGTSASLGERWQYVSSISWDGVYYVYQGSADVAANAGDPGSPWQVTIIAEGTGACPGTIGGDVEISGGPDLVPHPGAFNLAIAAGRDVNLSGNPSMAGLVAAHEQIASAGTTFGAESSLLAEGACDSDDDDVDVTEISGNTTINNTGPISTPFPGTEMIPVIINWNEL